MMDKILTDEYDVIIIGGGITGAGTARDCARRGMKVLLVEKHDFTNGATAATMVCFIAAHATPSPIKSRHANVSRKT